MATLGNETTGQRVGDVHVRLNDLACHVGNLHEIIQTLVKRLDPVLDKNPKVAKAINDSKTEAEAPTSLSKDIQSIDFTIMLDINTLDNILDILEI